MNFLDILINEDKGRTFRGDCTIRTFSTALNISYEAATEFLRYSRLDLKGELTRRDKPEPKDFYSLNSNIMVITKQVTNHFTQVLRRGYNLSRFAEDNPRGTFIVGLPGHIAVVHNGQILDAWDSSNLDVQYYGKASKAKSKRALKAVLGDDYEKHMYDKTLNERVKEAESKIASVRKIATKITNQDLVGLVYTDLEEKQEYVVDEILHKSRKYKISIKNKSTGLYYKVTRDYLLSHADPKHLEKHYNNIIK